MRPKVIEEAPYPHRTLNDFKTTIIILLYGELSSFTHHKNCSNFILCILLRRVFINGNKVCPTTCKGFDTFSILVFTLFLLLLYPVSVLCVLIIDALKSMPFALIAIPLPLTLGELLSFRIIAYLMQHQALHMKHLLRFFSFP